MGTCHSKGSATYSTKGRNKKISLKEKLFDIQNSFDVFSITTRKRGKHLKVGDVLYQSNLASSKQREGWKMWDGSRIKAYENVKITSIKEYPTTIVVTGEIRIGTRNGYTERTISKRFNKNDLFMVAR